MNLAGPQTGLLEDAPLQDIMTHPLGQIMVVGISRRFRRMNHAGADSHAFRN